MAEPHHLDLKESGNKSYQAGNYREAISLYSQAIALNATCAPLYHNRAVAYVRLGELADALRDAQAAIDNERTYAKAYSTKGTVLVRMGRNEEAIAAYKAGLDASPGNSMLLERLREATRPAAPPPSQPPRPSAPTGSATPSAFATKYGATLAPVIEAARVFLLLAFIASLVLPMLLGEEAGGRAHTLVLGVAAALHGLQLFLAHGIPQFNAEWISRLLEDPLLHLIFLPLVFLLYRPLSLVAVAVCLEDWLFALAFVHKLAAARAPAVATLLEQAGAAVLPYLSPAAQGASTAASLPRAGQWNFARRALPRLCAHFEIGLMLIVAMEVLTPHRNLLVAVVLYQLSTFRFMFSEATRTAWGGIDAGIRGFTSHPRCPGAVASVYDRLSRGLRSLVKSKDELIAQQMAQERARTEGAGAGAAAGGVAGLMSKCSVM